VAVISTGDEIIEPGADMVLGKIYDSNLYTVVAQLESYGAEVVYRECASDDSQFVASRIMEMAENVDLIVTTGGVSVGKMDIMHDVLNILDIKPLFWKVAIKPGMPTLTSIYNGKLMICLSGNPYGAFANTQLLVKPTVLKIANRPDYETKRVKATILNAYPKKSPVTRYVRAYYENNVVRLADGSNDSGIFSNLCGCNCMVEIPQGPGAVENGEEVTVVLL
jgi:molybdopterin molybdotransferase